MKRDNSEQRRTILRVNRTPEAETIREVQVPKRDVHSVEYANVSVCKCNWIARACRVSIVLLVLFS